MSIKLYKENGLYYFGERIHPAGTCFLFLETNGTITIKNVSDSQNLYTKELVTNFVNASGTPYATINDFISNVGGFFMPYDTGTNGAASVNIASVNGKIAGSFFGDNFVITERRPICSAKWSQGLPTFDCKTTWTGLGGELKVLDDLNTAGKYDGVLSISTLTGANRGLFWTSNKKNRYLPGHLSFFGYTWSWHNIANANGDFEALVGAFLRGAVSLGASATIKEAICFGYVRVSGVTKFVLRVYKNYTKVLEKEIPNIGLNFENLNIFEHQIGYYGIHPSIIWWFDSANKQHKLFDYTPFNQAYTSVADPNFSVGAWLQNTTNTVPIEIRNGSIEFGNYNTRNEPFDASARPCIDDIKIASLAVDPVDTDGSGFLAAYRVLDVVSMPKKVNALGVTNANFESAISNQLININASAIIAANRIVTLNVWFVPVADVTATFTLINPDENVLAKATTATVNFANARLLAKFPVTANSLPIDVSQFQYLLSNGTVAVLSLISSSATTVTDINIILNTRDLF